MTFLAMLAHYSAMYVIVAENLAALVTIILLPPRVRFVTSRLWLLAQGVLAAAYLPWLVWAREPIFGHGSDWMRPIVLPGFMERTLVAVGAGTTVEATFRLAVLGGVSLILTIALGALLRTKVKGEKTALVLAGLYFVVPGIVLFAFSTQRPMFDERHLVIMVAPFALVASFGLVYLTRRAWLACGLAAVLIGSLAIPSLANYYFNPAFGKSANWRSLTSEIRKQEKNGDYIVINIPDPTFAYYYRGRTPVGLLPARVPVDRVETEQELTSLMKTYQRIWFIPGASPFYDADALVEKWLTANTYKVGEGSFSGTRLALFSTEQIPVKDPSK